MQLTLDKMTSLCQC